MNQREVFFRHLAQTSPAPFGLEVSHAEGIEIFANDGQSYLDLISGISVSNLGHAHPDVIHAIKAQLDKHMHVMVYGEFLQSAQINFASKLTSLLPDSLSSVYFVNSGSEAVEGAIKLARKYTGRKHIVSFHGAYHGSTMGALSLMGNANLQKPFLPLLQNVTLMHLNNQDELHLINEDTACVILEPVQGEAGLYKADNDFLTALSEKCRQCGSLLIFDEIQSGMGRTSTLFYFQQTPVVPDILLTAKALGCGMPLGAFISSQEIMQSLSDHPALSHITTFGGHPVCCASGLAALEVLINEKLMESVAVKSALFQNKLQNLPRLKEIRHAGLFLALDFKDAGIVQSFVSKAYENGLILDWFLFNDRSVRIAPPLIITEEQIEEACSRLLRCAP